MNVVVLGAGYAGLTLTRKLERSIGNQVDLLVVDHASNHVVQHELHRAIRRPAVADSLSTPIETLFDLAQFRQARVTGLDTETRSITINESESINYDVAAVCLGAVTNFHGLPGIEAYATPLKRLDHAMEIRDQFLSVLEDGGRVVIGGAGLSGIQVAGELAALAREQGRQDVVDIVLTEQMDSIAPGFPPEFQTAVRKELESRDVELVLESPVTHASDDYVKIGGGKVAYDQLIWTGGIKGTSVLNDERPVVNGSLQLADRTFVVGDAAQVINRNGELIMPSAQAAVAEAKTASKNIKQIVEIAKNGTNDFPPRLTTIDFSPTGWIVSVGDGTVAQIGPTILRGRPAHALKVTVGMGYLSSIGAVTQAVDRVIDEIGLGG